jgi:23S rRNA (guanosine2251-2'-O)-methyltransferase
MVKREPASQADILYGINAVKEAIGKRPMEYILVTAGHRGPRVQGIMDACRAQGISLRFVPSSALERVAGTAQHQNVVAVCSAKTYDDLETLIAVSERPLLVVLDGVEDPANLGAVVRTATAAGADGVVIPERRAAGLSPAVARAAAGALEHMRIARVTNLVRALVELKQRNVWIYGFEASASKSYLDLDCTVACALVLGGEGRGLHRLVREACDEVGHIPLYGPVQSLNVSVASAVVLYEAARQRHSSLTPERAEKPSSDYLPIKR